MSSDSWVDSLRRQTARSHTVGRLRKCSASTYSGGVAYHQAAKQAYSSLRGYAVGLFWKQFGDASGLMKDLLAAHCTAFRIHLHWAGASHDYSHKEADALLQF